MSSILNSGNSGDAHVAGAVRYFMTDEDQDAAIGRLITKYSAAKKRRAALLAEARSVGETLDGAGTILKQLAFYQEIEDGSEVHYGGSKRTSPTLPDYADVEKTRALIADLKAVSSEVRELRKLVKDSGLGVD